MYQPFGGRAAEAAVRRPFDFGHLDRERYLEGDGAQLLADNALYRLRAAQGVVGLADRHDPSRLEAACAKAIAAGDPSYRTIKGILAAGTDRDQLLEAAAGDGGAGAFLHGAASFANVVAMPGTITTDELDMPTTGNPS